MKLTDTYEAVVHGQLVTVKRYAAKKKRARRTPANISDPTRVRELALILGVDVDEEAL